MLAAVFILVISVAALVQFVVFTWRAGLLRVASEPLLGEQTGREMFSNPLQSKDFDDVSAFQRLCPEMGSGTGPNLRSVRMYHSFLLFLNNLTGSAEEGWAHREMAVCTRYATVVFSQRMQRNQALAAEARSF